MFEKQKKIFHKRKTAVQALKSGVDITSVPEEFQPAFKHVDFIIAILSVHPPFIFIAIIKMMEPLRNFFIIDVIEIVHQKLISLFAKEQLSQDDMNNYLCQIFDKRLTECDREYSEDAKSHIDAFIKKVLKITGGRS